MGIRSGTRSTTRASRFSGAPVERHAEPGQQEDQPGGRAAELPLGDAKIS
ncbi:hypothetical protein [Actinokineospora globicatena]|nr:hypothetical protein [Actinokineospora globicatena]